MTVEGTERKRPTEIRVGHDYVSRARPSEPWNYDWYRVIEVRWIPREGTYYIKVERPESLRNRLSDHFHVRPTVRIETRPDDGSTAERSG